MKVRIAVCDDEPIIYNNIKERLEKICVGAVIDTYGSGETLIMSGNKYDVIFLDIQMPSRNGIEVAGILRENGYKGYIVFLTAYREYMQEAFKVRAFRYLDKLCKDSELYETINAIEDDLKKNINVAISSGGKKLYVRLRDIVYIESYGDKTIIHIADGEVIESNRTLCYWNDVLQDKNFYRIHKSFVVSLRHVYGTGKEGVLIKNGKTVLPISRKQKKKFMEILEENVIGDIFKTVNYFC